MPMNRVSSLVCAAALVCVQPATAQGNNREVIEQSIEVHIFKPAKVDATEERISQLKVPSGFTVTRFADQIGRPRMLAVAPNGNVYVSDRDAGTVTLLRDPGRTGKATKAKEVARRHDLHGLALQDDRLYMAAARQVYVADIRPDGTLGEPVTLYNDLPDVGQHPNRTLAFSPDGKLILSIASTCNACPEKNKESATMVELATDGSGRRVIATGLRNTIGFDWHPVTATLWGFDHGIDWLGDSEQQEELNEITRGADYGWPYVYAGGKPNLADEPPDGQSYADIAGKSVAPTLLYTAHAAPMGMVFYTSSLFPAEYRGDAFVTMHGSWNRAAPSGYKVVRVRFNKQGRPTGFEDFAAGWLVDDNRAHFGRVCGIAQHTDGSLLVSDDANGVIYRIAYTALHDARQAGLPP
jgi:glucose/arabinose dehydrogenase